MTISHLDGHRRPLPRHAPLAIESGRVGATFIVTVRGEIDAHNAKDFAVAVCDATAGHRVVDVDLGDLAFAGVDAISALHAINAQMRRRDADWTVLPNRTVTRLLDLCDPERLIPRPADEVAAEPA